MWQSSAHGGPATEFFSLDSAEARALDITCLFTLDYLGLLADVIAHFDHAVIAPSTLSHLFMERQFLRIHQPSEVAKAQRLQALIAGGRIKLLNDGTATNTALGKDIGRDLATLLETARRDGGLVVRSAPVTKLGSFLEEKADLSEYATELTDTLAVLSFLSQGGKLDAAQIQTASGYLKQVDTGWQRSPVISPGTKLYLDDLTIIYLDHVGLLDPLIGSGVSVFAHADVGERTRQVLHHGEHAAELLAATDRIRETVAEAIEGGKITFSARKDKGADEGEPSDAGPTSSPSLDIMSDLSGIDAVVVDDRCLNKLPRWSDNLKRSAAAGTSLKVLVALHVAGKINEKALWRCRHKLRIAGYYAMPLEANELEHHLREAPIDGTLRETPELRAIRESLALALINDAFTSAEAKWLNHIRLAISKVIGSVWLREEEVARAEARSDWLLSILPNPLEWCLEPGNETVWASVRQQAALQVGYLTLFVQGTREQKRRYFAWLRKALLDPLRKSHPELWDGVLAFVKSNIVRLVESDK